MKGTKLDIQIRCMWPVGMPQSGSETKFEPEPFGTRPKFGPRFDGCAELDHKSSSGFGQGTKPQNRLEPGSNRTFVKLSLDCCQIYITSYPYSSYWTALAMFAV